MDEQSPEEYILTLDMQPALKVEEKLSNGALHIKLKSLSVHIKADCWLKMPHNSFDNRSK